MHRAMENGARIVSFQKDVVLDGDDTGIGQPDRVVGALLQILHVYADHERPYPQPHVFFVHEHVKRDGLQWFRENYASAKLDDSTSICDILHDYLSGRESEAQSEEQRRVVNHPLTNPHSPRKEGNNRFGV